MTWMTTHLFSSEPHESVIPKYTPVFLPQTQQTTWNKKQELLSKTYTYNKLKLHGVKTCRCILSNSEPVDINATKTFS